MRGRSFKRWSRQSCCVDVSAGHYQSRALCDKLNECLAEAQRCLHAPCRTTHDEWRTTPRLRVSGSTSATTWWPWVTVGTYCYVAVCRRDQLGGARREALRRPQREERGGAYCGGRPPTSCCKCSWEVSAACWTLFKIIIIIIIIIYFRIGERCLRWSFLKYMEMCKWWCWWQYIGISAVSTNREREKLLAALTVNLTRLERAGN